MLVYASIQYSQIKKAIHLLTIKRYYNGDNWPGKCLMFVVWTVTQAACTYTSACRLTSSSHGSSDYSNSMYHCVVYSRKHFDRLQAIQ